MDPRLNIVTLGVRDLAVAARFYREGFGWKPAVETSDFMLFEMGNGVAIALYPYDLLAEDAGLSAGARSFGGITLAQNVASRADVDRTIAAACAVGATLLKAGTDKDWGGYSGYFADPDGYPWEIAFHPQFRLDERGRLIF